MLLKITVDSKPTNHLFYNKGSKSSFFINGNSGIILKLIIGKRYKFIIDTPGHPFYFTKSEEGGLNDKENVIINGFKPIEKGEFEVTISQDLKIFSYYQCKNHSYMGGKLMFITPGNTSNTKQSIMSLNKNGSSSSTTTTTTQEEDMLLLMYKDTIKTYPNTMLLLQYAFYDCKYKLSYSDKDATGYSSKLIKTFIQRHFNNHINDYYTYKMISSFFKKPTELSLITLKNQAIYDSINKNDDSIREDVKIDDIVNIERYIYHKYYPFSMLPGIYCFKGNMIYRRLFLLLCKGIEDFIILYPYTKNMIERAFKDSFLISYPLTTEYTINENGEQWLDLSSEERIGLLYQYYTKEYTNLYNDDNIPTHRDLLVSSLKQLMNTIHTFLKRLKSEIQLEMMIYKDKQDRENLNLFKDDNDYFTPLIKNFIEGKVDNIYNIIKNMLDKSHKAYEYMILRWNTPLIDNTIDLFFIEMNEFIISKEECIIYNDIVDYHYLSFNKKITPYSSYSASSSLLNRYWNVLCNVVIKNTSNQSIDIINTLKTSIIRLFRRSFIRLYNQFYNIMINRGMKEVGYWTFFSKDSSNRVNNNLKQNTLTLYNKYLNLDDYVNILLQSHLFSIYHDIEYPNNPILKHTSINNEYSVQLSTIDYIRRFINKDNRTDEDNMIILCQSFKDLYLKGECIYDENTHTFHFSVSLPYYQSQLSILRLKQELLFSLPNNEYDLFYYNIIDTFLQFTTDHHLISQSGILSDINERDRKISDQVLYYLLNMIYTYVNNTENDDLEVDDDNKEYIYKFDYNKLLTIPTLKEAIDINQSLNSKHKWIVLENLYIDQHKEDEEEEEIEVIDIIEDKDEDDLVIINKEENESILSSLDKRIETLIRRFNNTISINLFNNKDESFVSFLEHIIDDKRHNDRVIRIIQHYTEYILISIYNSDYYKKKNVNHSIIDSKVWYGILYAEIDNKKKAFILDDNDIYMIKNQSIKLINREKDIPKMTLMNEQRMKFTYHKPLPETENIYINKDAYIEDLFKTYHSGYFVGGKTSGTIVMYPFIMRDFVYIKEEDEVDKEKKEKEELALYMNKIKDDIDIMKDIRKVVIKYQPSHHNNMGDKERTIMVLIQKKKQEQVNKTRKAAMLLSSILYHHIYVYDYTKCTLNPKINIEDNIFNIDEWRKYCDRNKDKTICYNKSLDMDLIFMEYIENGIFADFIEVNYAYSITYQDKPFNMNLLIHSIIQITSYLYSLYKSLQLVHKDLKLDNLFVQYIPYNQINRYLVKESKKPKVKIEDVEDEEDTTQIKKIYMKYDIEGMDSFILEYKEYIIKVGDYGLSTLNYTALNENIKKERGLQTTFSDINTKTEVYKDIDILVLLSLQKIIHVHQKGAMFFSKNPSLELANFLHDNYELLMFVTSVTRINNIVQLTKDYEYSRNKMKNDEQLKQLEGLFYVYNLLTTIFTYLLTNVMNIHFYDRFKDDVIELIKRGIYKKNGFESKDDYLMHNIISICITYIYQYQYLLFTYDDKSSIEYHSSGYQTLFTYIKNTYPSFNISHYNNDDLYGNNDNIVIDMNMYNEIDKFKGMIRDNTKQSITLKRSNEKPYFITTY